MIIIKKDIIDWEANDELTNRKLFTNYIKIHYNLNDNDYYVKDNSGRFIRFENIDSYRSFDNFYVQPKLRGGILGGGGNPFKPVIQPIKDIGSTLGDIAKFFVLLYKAVVFLIKMSIWIIQFVIWLITDFLNPLNFIQDFIGNVLKITRLIIIGTVDMIFGLIKKVFNTIFSKLFSGSIFGWDQTTYDRKNKKTWENGPKGKQNINNDDNCSNNDKQNPDNECYEGDKCYETPPGKIPFTIIIATILCPPIGVFMQFGLSYWINILICGVLTLALYFPGLIYALVMLYC